MKPNTKFELSVNDIEIIEKALRAKAGRRGMKILQGDKDFKALKDEADEIMDLLGRIHQQKVWFRPKKQTYVGG
jgi:predicted nuclease with TOPRIM domain